MLSLLPGTECVEVLPKTTGRRPKARGLTWGLVQDRDDAVGGILVIAQEGDKEARTYLVTEFVPDRGFRSPLWTLGQQDSPRDSHSQPTHPAHPRPHSVRLI